MLAKRLQTGYLNSLNLSFFIFKMRTLKVLNVIIYSVKVMINKAFGVDNVLGSQ